MSEFNKIGGIGVLGFISPINTKDTYPVIDPLYGIDGFRNVKTIDEMLSIPEERRRAGMIVGVHDSEQYFKLKNTEWTGLIDDWDEIFFQTASGRRNDEVVYVDKEIPLGLIDNNNKVFRLSKTPIENSEHVFLNGLLQDIDEDYIVMDNYLIFTDSPPINSKIRCSYRSL